MRASLNLPQEMEIDHIAKIKSFSAGIGYGENAETMRLYLIASVRGGAELRYRHEDVCASLFSTQRNLQGLACGGTN